MKKSVLKSFAVAAVVSLVSSLGHAQVRSETAPTKNIVEIAVASGSFTTLVAAVKAANLVETLSSPGPFTVFAPTDAAFAKLPAGTVEALLKDIPALTRILTYHVVGGTKTPNQLLKERFVTTVQGGKVRVQVSQGRLFINKSEVVLNPIMASNGVIYVIDAVLIP